MRYPLASKIAVLLSLVLLYAGLVQKYRAYDVDNPWFLSFSYNACHGDIETDTFQEIRYPGGMDGVHLFGKVPAAIQCSVMNRTGWTPFSIVELNTVFGILSLCLWWSLFSHLGYRHRWIVCFVLFLGVTEPMVSMMEKARYEFFAFFLLSAAFWLAGRGQEFAAILTGMLAVESEPAAMVVVVLTLLLLALRTKDWKSLSLKCGAAACLAIAFYWKLHPAAMFEMAHAQHLHTRYVIGGTLRAYFVDRRRHIPELIMFLIAGWLARQHWSTVKSRVGIWLALASGVVLFFAPHPNPSYMVFAMPFLLWGAGDAYDASGRWRWVPASVFLGILIQYAYLYRINRNEGFDSQDFKSVQARISESADAMHIPDTRLHVCGDYSLWFAHPRNYSVCSLAGPNAAVWKGDLYLCFNGPLEEHDLSSPEWLSCAEIQNSIPIRELSSLYVRGHLLHIYSRR